MDNKNVVKRLLDSMFENNQLISATVNVKSGLSLFNIRFDNAILDPNSEPVTYVKKSKYHVTRDKERSDLHRQSKRDRKQTQFFDSSKELLRSDNHENSAVSAPGLSPISVYEEPCGGSHSSSPFIPSESPNENKAAMCTESLFSDGMFDKIAQAESLVRSLHTSWESSPMSVPEEKSTPAKTHDELKLPDCLDTSLFRTHLINADKEWSAVKCDTCAVSAYDYTVGGCHMLYCPACRHYSCEDCCVEDYDRKSKNSTYYCSHCNKPIFDITGPRTYECLGE